MGTTRARPRSLRTSTPFFSFSTSILCYRSLSVVHHPSAFPHTPYLVLYTPPPHVVSLRVDSTRVVSIIVCRHPLRPVWMSWSRVPSSPSYHGPGVFPLSFSCVSIPGFPVPLSRLLVAVISLRGPTPEVFFTVGRILVCRVGLTPKALVAKYIGQTPPPTQLGDPLPRKTYGRSPTRFTPTTALHPSSILLHRLPGLPHCSILPWVYLETVHSLRFSRRFRHRNRHPNPVT